MRGSLRTGVLTVAGMLTLLMGCMAREPVCIAFALQQPIGLEDSSFPLRRQQCHDHMRTHPCHRRCRVQAHEVTIATSSAGNAARDERGHAAVASNSWILAQTKALSKKLLAAMSQRRNAAQPGTRGARRPRMRELYMQMTAEERAQHRYECAKIRLAIEAEAYGYSTRPDLDATDSNLELATRMAVARRLIRQHEAEILWYEANQNNEKRAAAEAWLAQQLLQDAGTPESEQSGQVIGDMGYDSSAGATPLVGQQPVHPAPLTWAIEFMKWRIEFRVGLEPVGQENPKQKA